MAVQKFAVDVDYGDRAPGGESEFLMARFARPADLDLAERVRKLGKMTNSTPTSVIRQMILHCLKQAGV